MLLLLSILPTYFFFRAVCREETKEGVCPKLSRDSFRSEMSCSDECSSDSDCSGDNKCCYNGCSYSCLKAVKDPNAADSIYCRYFFLKKNFINYHLENDLYKKNCCWIKSD